MRVVLLQENEFHWFLSKPTHLVLAETGFPGCTGLSGCLPALEAKRSSACQDPLKTQRPLSLCTHRVGIVLSTKMMSLLHVSKMLCWSWVFSTWANYSLKVARCSVSYTCLRGALKFTCFGTLPWEQTTVRYILATSVCQYENGNYVFLDSHCCSCCWVYFKFMKAGCILCMLTLWWGGGMGLGRET